MADTGIDWQIDTKAPFATHGQTIYTAEIDGHTLMLVGDTSRPENDQWIAQIDGRMVSDGRTTRDAATAAAQSAISRLLGPAGA
jgi:hypothetical protein